MKQGKSKRSNVLKPGELNAYWEMILKMRDTNDPRWEKSLSSALRASALAYERNKLAVSGG